MKYLIPILIVLAACSHKNKPVESTEVPEAKTQMFYSGNNTLKFIHRGHAVSVRIMAGNDITGDTCDLEGEFLPAGQGVYTWNDAEVNCRVKMVESPEKLNLEYIGKCHDYCGMSASLPEEFRIRPPECTQQNVVRRRSDGADLYQQKKFAEAAKVFGNLRETCQNFIDIVMNNWLINDEALSYYRMGDARKCYATLKPLDNWIVAKGEEESLPNENESIKNLRQSINHNFKLCKKKAKR